MKKSIQALIMAAAMLAGPMVFTSCEEILGEWSRPAPVQKVNVSGVTLNKSNLDLEVGDESTQLIATVISDDAAYKTVMWQSDNEAIATVDASGNVMAKAAGIATITCIATNGTDDPADDQKTTCTVTVEAVTASTPLTFQAKEAGAKVKFDIYTTVATNPVEFRTCIDHVWGEWGPYTSSDDIVLTHVGDKVQFRGDNAAYADGGGNSHFSCTAGCYAYGNIMSLNNSTTFSTYTAMTKHYVFYRLFMNNSCLLSHGSKRFLLPATNVAPYCYESMFEGCTSLTTGPLTLPATSTSESSYKNMFKDCCSLITAPTISATNLGPRSCVNMFIGCSSLITAPAISATVIPINCCESMFEGCTSLTTSPALSATSINPSSYKNMFKGCSSLVTAPAISATDIPMSCCESMFEGCTSLTTSPALSATSIGHSSYKNMFKGCSSLVTAPAISATSLAVSCCVSMFEGCTSLTTAPTLLATNMSSYCYQSMFKGCTKLSSVTCLAIDPPYNGTTQWLDGAGTDASVTSRTLHVKNGQESETWNTPTGTYAWSVSGDQ